MLTDAVVLVRAMFGLTGTTATNNAIGVGATRTKWATIRPYLNGSCGTTFAPLPACVSSVASVALRDASRSRNAATGVARCGVTMDMEQRQMGSLARITAARGAPERAAARIAERMAMAALLGVAANLAFGQVTYDVSSLRGTYSYVNIAENVASFGLIHFDGKGKLTASIKVNRPLTTGGRTITTLSESGSYTVTPDGQGVATIQFQGVPEPAVYDFLITQTAPPTSMQPKKGKSRSALATEVFSVNRSGGLNGQVVAPSWTRRADQ
jgi:hypothetical protein